MHNPLKPDIELNILVVGSSALIFSVIIRHAI